MEPTLFSLTNPRQVSSQPGLYTQRAWAGELAPPGFGACGSRSSLWPVHGSDTDGLPKHPGTPSISAWTTCMYAGSREGFSGLLQFLHLTVRTAVSTAPTPQPLGHCWCPSFYISSQLLPVSQLLHFCCSQRTIRYLAFRFSAAVFQQSDISFVLGM